MERAINPELANNPVILRVMRDALSIQERFSPEPVYARTGRGFLKSAGVKELSTIKALRKRKKA